MKYQGRDFILKNGKNYYYFAFDLQLLANEHVLGGKSMPLILGTLEQVSNNFTTSYFSFISIII